MPAISLLVHDVAWLQHGLGGYSDLFHLPGETYEIREWAEN